MSGTSLITRTVDWVQTYGTSANGPNPFGLDPASYSWTIGDSPDVGLVDAVAPTDNDPGTGFELLTSFGSGQVAGDLLTITVLDPDGDVAGTGTYTSAGGGSSPIFPTDFSLSADTIAFTNAAWARWGDLHGFTFEHTWTWVGDVGSRQLQTGGVRVWQLGTPTVWTVGSVGF